MTQNKGKKPNTAGICAELAASVAEQMGLCLWDVVFEKEGAGWYLRYFIDKDEGGVDINECEQFSRAMSDILDTHDPIDQSYCLEVSSPGIERKLVKDWHFKKYLGEQVVVKLIRPVEGIREFVGELSDYNDEDGSITINLDEEIQMTFTMEETAYVKLYISF